LQEIFGDKFILNRQAQLSDK